MGWIKKLIYGAVKPVTDVLGKRQDRKKAVQTAAIKLQQAKSDNEKQLKFNDQEWEAIQAAVQASSWKDEYVTVSVVSFLNLIILGGLAQAFGFSHILEGVSIAIGTLVEAEVDIGFLLEAVILSAVGLSIWRKI